MLRRTLSMWVAALAVGALALSWSGTSAFASDKHATALELAKIVMPKDTYHKTLKALLAGMLPALQGTGKKVDPDNLLAALEEALPYEELQKITADLYGNHFTVAELQEVIAFYKTPTGGKLVSEMPGIAAESSRRIMAILPQRLPQILKKRGIGR